MDFFKDRIEIEILQGFHYVKVGYNFLWYRINPSVPNSKDHTCFIGVDHEYFLRFDLSGNMLRVIIKDREITTLYVTSLQQAEDIILSYIGPIWTSKGLLISNIYGIDGADYKTVLDRLFSLSEEKQS